jgi:aspartyl-tRNA(Asn)/glutamyl-tRNA(Gln) amidotransferase subunit A
MPMENQLAFASIAEIGKLYRQRKLSPVELTRFVLDRIERINPSLNAYLAVCGELALEQAALAEAELSTERRGKSRRDRGPLHGIPISLKDNIYTAGVPTTGGSKILVDFVPSLDAQVVTALKRAGTLLLGKTNLHEFAYGVTTNNPHFGPAHNPWDLQRIPGGSSGGSAAALAAGLCYGSIGTDTGGSIRIPASLCGVVGLKPGLGRVSAEGVIPLSPTLDFVGPLARSVSDAALLLEPIFAQGRSEGKLRFGPSPSTRDRRVRLGIPKEFFLDVLSPEVERAFEMGLGILRKRGAQLKEVSIPGLKDIEDAGNQIAWPEALHFHQKAGWFPARSGEYGEDVRTRLEAGTRVSAVSYFEAVEVREHFIKAWQALFQENDLHALVTPTTPITAPRIGEESLFIRGKSYSTRALLLRLNRPANLAGVPAISVPCGRDRKGLPMGLQFMGSINQEALLLKMAHDFERACSLDIRPDLDSLG